MKRWIAVLALRRPDGGRRHRRSRGPRLDRAPHAQRGIVMIIQTALGPVDHEGQGTGTPVLVLHGSPGGIDAARLMARILPPERFRAILLSRPGYLDTPLDRRESIDAQADLVAAVLDELGIDRATVYSWSGGGPAGSRLAVRRPERVTAIVANAAVSHSYVLPDQDL